MPSYKFVGEAETVFADIRTVLGETLHAFPGEVYELAESVTHALLTPAAPTPLDPTSVAPEATDAPSTDTESN